MPETRAARVPLPVEHVRALCDTREEIDEQRITHIHGLVEYLRSHDGARIDPAVGVTGLKASEQRRYDRLVAEARQVEALITPSVRATNAAPPTISVDYAARVLALS